MSASFDFDQWQAEQTERYRQTQERIRATLATGGTVTETLGRLVKGWRLGNGPFIEPFNSDPVYLADHLISRHRGFGTRLDFA